MLTGRNSAYKLNVFVKRWLNDRWALKGIRLSSFLTRLSQRVPIDSYTVVAYKLHDTKEVFVGVFSTDDYVFTKYNKTALREEKWFTDMHSMYGADAIKETRYGMFMPYELAEEQAIMYLNKFFYEGWKIINSDWHVKTIKRIIPLKIGARRFDLLEAGSIKYANRSFVEVLKAFVISVEKNPARLSVYAKKSNECENNENVN